jgi:hypothetical protein
MVGVVTCFAVLSSGHQSGCQINAKCRGYDSVTGPQNVKAAWPHLDVFEDRMTEVAGPICDTPGVV